MSYKYIVFYKAENSLGLTANGHIDVEQDKPIICSSDLRELALQIKEECTNINIRNVVVTNFIRLDNAEPPFEFIGKLTKQKDAAYSERNKLLAGYVKLAWKSGINVGLAKHEGEEWDDDWRNIVYIELPTGQVTWHIHDSEIDLFDWMNYIDYPPEHKFRWDGHTTEEKYKRLLDFDPFL